MSQIERAEITRKRVVYEVPGMDAVTIRRDEPYQGVGEEGAARGALTFDVYYPSQWRSGTRTPAVLFVSGFSDAGMQRMVGCKMKEMESYVSWARLVAASGLVAITYSALNPPADVQAVLRHVSQNAESLGIDEKRLGVWACSGNVPNALSILMENNDVVKCAALCYGFTLDLDGSTLVADAASTIRFANPCAGKSVEDLPPDLPLFIARAGHDEVPHLNETIDRFVMRALHRNLPITLANHRDGPHAFDLLHDSETSRGIIRQILAFLRFHLLAA